MPAIHRVLVPVDFSESSERAADYAVALARQLGAGVHFLHAWQMPVYAFPDGAVILGPDVVAQITTELQRSLDALVERHKEPELAVEGHLAQGLPDREIVRAAGELGCELIVMGTHGRTGLPHLFLGSVAERVVRSSSVPVLTVPPDRTKHK
ncbi:universal stress protein [Sandaracinus amylolyticus]|uniref:Universal stress protein family n=1 Tax=Sandaracinus amylolyticus TaxID=927083 RepID=A0A0F6W6F7_9BACT|nr:universal stress protein [Sandaracinus amylolyticus]AKF08508.1 Universal stress protein family [Sandaracinus amylolyticus]